MERKTILVAEDDPALQELLCRTLLRHGFETVCASDGAEAFRLFQESQQTSADRGLHVLVTDYLMPQMNGGALARKIKAIDRFFPVVLVTGEAPDQEILELASFPRLTAVMKPFRSELLIDAIRQLLEESPSDGTAEIRRSTRLETRIAAVVNQRIRVVIRNLSFEGCFLESAWTPKVNEELILCFQGLEQYPIPARVVWLRPAADGKPSGTGICFAPVSTEVSEFLKKFVLNRLKQAGMGIKGVPS